jgi:2-oxoglutarate ferredoxin oxidoreductase subunit beta
MVDLHDGSRISLRKLEEDYDPTNRLEAINRLQSAAMKQEFITGMIYIDNERPNLAEVSHLSDTPLAHLSDQDLRPSEEKLKTFLKAFA